MNLYVTSVPPDPDETKNFTIILDGKRINVRGIFFERETVEGEDGYPYETGRTIVNLKFYAEVTRGND